MFEEIYPVRKERKLLPAVKKYNLGSQGHQSHNQNNKFE
jgi:hypothetical protein